MITYQILESKGACESQAKLFKEMFPNGTEVSVELAVSVASNFDFDWAASNLLSEEGLVSFKEARTHHRAAYKKAVVRPWEDYYEAVARHFAVYKEARTHHWAAYKEAIARPRAVYEEAIARHRVTYKESVAKIFAELYIKENQ